MIKKRMRGALLAAAFFLLLAAAVAGVSRIVERKQSRRQFEPFWDRPQELDVLFLGDSHMVNGVFPMELWRDYGLTGYNLSCYGNTLPVTYWIMMNALDYAQPELIVLGVKDVEKSYKVSGSSGDLHNALDCFPLTLTKARALEDLMDDPNATDDEGHRYADMKWEYYFTLGKYHGRWSELSTSDFRYTLNCQKGAEMAVRVSKTREYDIIDDMMDESGWGFSYLRRIIEECEGRGIDLLLVHIPHPADETAQQAGNTVASIAEEYGLNYIDFVNMDQVVDYSVDCFDSFSHLNPAGARKVTDYLGRFITEHYPVADHRGEAAYSQWDVDYDAYADYKLSLIRQEEKLKDVLMLLHDAHFSVCLSIDAGSAVYKDEQMLTLLQNIAREHVYEEDAYSKWSNALFPLEQLDEAAALGERYFLLVDRGTGTLLEHTGDSGTLERETSFGVVRYDAQSGGMRIGQDGAQGTETTVVSGEYGVQVLVVDERTHEVAASLRF